MVFLLFVGFWFIFDIWLMWLEDEMKEGCYEVCVEFFGVDFDKDVDIMVCDG